MVADYTELVRCRFPWVPVQNYAVGMVDQTVRFWRTGVVVAETLVAVRTLVPTAVDSRNVG